MSENNEKCTRTKADFRALRETVGLTQQGLCDRVDVSIRTTKRWENPEYEGMPPADVWDELDEAKADQDAAVELAVATAEEVSRDHDDAKRVRLSYFQSQDGYDDHHKDGGDYLMANANARRVAAVLESRGYEIAYDYALRIPTSLEGIAGGRESGIIVRDNTVMVVNLTRLMDNQIPYVAPQPFWGVVPMTCESINVVEERWSSDIREELPGEIVEAGDDVTLEAVGMDVAEDPNGDIPALWGIDAGEGAEIQRDEHGDLMPTEGRVLILDADGEEIKFIVPANWA